MQNQVHEFDNGVKIFEHHLTDFQRARYQKRNVHEAEEEDIFLKVIKTIPADGCFLNIGAAVGYYSILAKKLSPALTIHAVEPLVTHRKFFEENVRLNGFNRKDFILHSEAISSLNGDDSLLDQDYGSVLMRENRGPKSLKSTVQAMWKALVHSANFNDMALKDKKKFNVRTITLDHLMKRIRKQVDLLLMDIQGLEVDVLKGGVCSLQSGKINTLIIGTHGREIHLECMATLKEYGLVVEYEEPNPKEQPDGIILASMQYQRLETR